MEKYGHVSAQMIDGYFAKDIRGESEEVVDREGGVSTGICLHPGCWKGMFYFIIYTS